MSRLKTVTTDSIKSRQRKRDVTYKFLKSNISSLECGGSGRCRLDSLASAASWLI